MSAISNVDICNGALQRLGARRIATLADQTPSARACNLAYDFCRRAELRKHDWNFSILRASLPADNPVPAWGRQNSFTLSANFLRLAPGYPELLTQDANVIGSTVAFTAQFSGYKDWVIEQSQGDSSGGSVAIVTNDTGPLQIRYVQDVTDTTRFDSLFTEALSCRIALRICEELTQSNEKKAAVAQEYKELIEEAKNANGIEVAPADPPPDTWLTARS